MTFAERLTSELQYQNKTYKSLADFIERDPSTVKSWVYHNAMPAADIALKVAQFLNVSLEYLITGEDTKPVTQEYFSTEEKNMVLKYRDFSAEQKQFIYMTFNNFEAQNETKRKTV